MKLNPNTLPSLASNSIVIGVLLAFVGGFSDAYTFVSRDGVFANAQTGNVVLLSIKIAQGEWGQSFIYLPPILAFILGVLTYEIVKIPKLSKVIYSTRRSILLIECILLIVVGVLPSGTPNIIVTTSISFVSSLQISTFNKLEKWPYNSTMTTGNLRTVIQSGYKSFVVQDQESKQQFINFTLIVLSFITGALSGTFLTIYIGNESICLTSVVLFITLVLYHREKGYFKKKFQSKNKRSYYNIND